MGFTIYATRGTSRFLGEHRVPNVRLYKIQERRSPSLLDSLAPGKADLVINIPLGYDRKELTDGYIIRRRAIDFGIPLITNIQVAELLVKSLATKTLADLEPRPYDDYVSQGGRPHPEQGDGHDRLAQRARGAGRSRGARRPVGKRVEGVGKAGRRARTPAGRGEAQAVLA
jgi:hypothetical protein